MTKTNKLRALRKQRCKKTVKQLMEAMDIYSPGTLSKWETGQTEISLTKAIKYCALTNITLDELAGSLLNDNEDYKDYLNMKSMRDSEKEGKKSVDYTLPIIQQEQDSINSFLTKEGKTGSESIPINPDFSAVVLGQNPLSNIYMTERTKLSIDSGYATIAFSSNWDIKKEIKAYDEAAVFISNICDINWYKIFNEPEAIELVSEFFALYYCENKPSHKDLYKKLLQNTLNNVLWDSYWKVKRPEYTDKNINEILLDKIVDYSESKDLMYYIETFNLTEDVQEHIVKRYKDITKEQRNKIIEHYRYSKFPKPIDITEIIFNKKTVVIDIFTDRYDVLMLFLQICRLADNISSYELWGMREEPYYTSFIIDDPAIIAHPIVIEKCATMAAMSRVKHSPVILRAESTEEIRKNCKDSTITEMLVDYVHDVVTFSHIQSKSPYNTIIAEQIED